MNIAIIIFACLGAVITAIVTFYVIVFFLMSLHFTICELIAELRIHVKFGGKWTDFKWWNLPLIMFKEVFGNFGVCYGDVTSITHTYTNGRAVYHVPRHIFSMGEIDYTMFTDEEHI